VTALGLPGGPTISARSSDGLSGIACVPKKEWLG